MSVECYDTAEDFRHAADSAWADYLDSLDPGIEPTHDMTFFGVVKHEGKFRVMKAIFNPSN